METLIHDLRLKIEDYGTDADTRTLIRSYQDLVSNYVNRNNLRIFVQTKTFI